LYGNGTEQVASAFFAAIEKGDLKAVREMYAPDVAVWHNVTGITQTRDENLELLKLWVSRVGELRYEILEREFFPDGFLQRHVVHGVVATGERVEAPVCIVVHVKDGKITRIFEYLDARSVAKVFGPDQAN
jgi:ketosteroid isomerase-like protein